MGLFKRVFGKRRNISTEAFQSNQELRDKISFGKLKFDRYKEKIELVEFNESEKGFLKVIFILNELWENNDLVQFDEMIGKASDFALCGLIGLYSELTDNEYDPLVHIQMIKLKRPQIDYADMYPRLVEDHRLRIYLRKIESYIVEKYEALDRVAFNKCIDDWEEAEKAATKSGLKIMHDIMIGGEKDSKAGVEV